MARYFFDLRVDDIFHPDTEGTELKDIKAAGIEAIEALAELAHDALPGSTGKRLTMTVHDGIGNQAFELDLVFRFSPAEPS